jgi:hypothetical protein
MLPNLRHLLFHIHTCAPAARIALSTISPLGIPNDLIDNAREAYNHGLPAIVDELQGDDFQIGLVNAGGRVTRDPPA